jgi:hypothetical protein
MKDLDAVIAADSEARAYAHAALDRLRSAAVRAPA